MGSPFRVGSRFSKSLLGRREGGGRKRKSSIVSFANNEAYHLRFHLHIWGADIFFPSSFFFTFYSLSAWKFSPEKRFPSEKRYPNDLFITDDGFPFSFFSGSSIQVSFLYIDVVTYFPGFG